jgi:hypothetical protein
MEKGGRVRSLSREKADDLAPTVNIHQLRKINAASGCIQNSKAVLNKKLRIKRS